MTLSIAVTAMSNLPSIRLVSWKAEPGVGVIFTATPLRWKKPFSSAIQIGQLKPPGKTISSMGLDCWACAGANVASSKSHGATALRIMMFPPVLCPVSSAFLVYRLWHEGRSFSHVCGAPEADADGSDSGLPTAMGEGAAHEADRLPWGHRPLPDPGVLG